MYADAIRRQAEEAPRAALPAVAAALWKAFASGQVTEAEAEKLSALIEERRAAPSRGPCRAVVEADLAEAGMRIATAARKSVGSRPRTAASLERRRRWAASGRLPPGIAVRFTVGEAAVLAVVAAEVAKRGACTLAHGHLAALAGVSISTVKRAFKAAAALGLLAVEVRKVSAMRNETNRVTILDRSWLAWTRLTRKAEGGGGQFRPGTPTSIPDSGISRKTEPSQGLPRGSGRPQPVRSRKNPGGW